MIELKRLNGIKFFLNSELIEQIEETPDTIITLKTGNNIVVLESTEEVIDKIIHFKAQVQKKAQQKDREGLRSRQWI